MRKTVTALLAAATLAGTLAVSTTDADARWRRGYGLGVAGAFLGGAIIGSAIANGRYYGGPPPVFYDGPVPVYVEPGPRCYLARGRPVWNGYRWIRPRVEVCD